MSACLTGKIHTLTYQANVCLNFARYKSLRVEGCPTGFTETSGQIGKFNLGLIKLQCKPWEFKWWLGCKLNSWITIESPSPLIWYSKAIKHPQFYQKNGGLSKPSEMVALQWSIPHSSSHNFRVVCSTVTTSTIGTIETAKGHSQWPSASQLAKHLRLGPMDDHHFHRWMATIFELW